MVDRVDDFGVVDAFEITVFEAAWDAIKLCLQIREHGVRRAWLITGASDEAWDEAESAELFGPGSADTVRLWRQRLDPPRAPNHGEAGRHGAAAGPAQSSNAHRAAT